MYTHSGDHLQAEFDRINWALSWAQENRDVFAGIDEETDEASTGAGPTLETVGAHIRALSGERILPESHQEQFETFRSELAQSAETIERDLESARERGVDLRLDKLRHKFRLSRAELDIFLLALAPVFDDSVPHVYGQLRDSSEPHHPTVSIVETLLALMGHGSTDSMRDRPSFSLSPNSPLFEYDLLNRHSDDPIKSASDDVLSVDDRIVQYLKGDDSLDPVLRTDVTVRTRQRERSDLVFDAETTDTLDSIHQRARATATPTIFYLSGEDGTGKDRLPAALTAAGEPLLQVDATDIFGKPGLITRLLREAALRDAAIHLQALEELTDRDDGPRQATDDDDSTPRLQRETDTPSVDDIVERLDGAPGNVFLSHTEAWTPDVDLSHHRLETCECPFPDHDVRFAVWEEYAAEFADESLIPHIATNFRLPQRDIRRAVRTARYLCRTGGEIDDIDDETLPAHDADADVFAPVEGELTRGQLYEACKRYSASNLEAMAEQLDPGYSWEDIALNDRQESHLKELCGHLQYRGAVTNEWGFGEPGSRGDGVVALFYGQPGTGKTMAAEIIANETGLDLYRVDLSQIINKYVGETDSRLATLLDEAERSNAILLFDEADAIFGKRAEVKDATDRYANTEINFLLQRLESFDGILLLTTNKRAGIDSAFKRRINHSIGFEKPQELIRRAFWEAVFPEEANVATEEFDYEFLGRITTTPALIRKVAKYAAYIAATDAHDGRPLADTAADLDDVTIQFKHIIQALQYAREAGGAGFQVEFGEYEQYRRSYDSHGVDRDWEEELERLQGSDEEFDEPTALDPEAGGRERATTPGKHSADQVSPADGRSPEEVVEEYVSRLADADDSAYDLCHSNARLETAGHRGLKMMQHGNLTIASEITRKQNDHDRVVLSFTQHLGGSHIPDRLEGEMPVRCELRPEDAGWRIFDLKRLEQSPSRR